MNEPSAERPVLILGAGVNGAAVARELVLNGVPVTIVDIADIATGATAKSSRLIHGGVRYLEYADFHLVSESLEERERQLRLAPQFVKPLRLHIPVKRRRGGLIQSGFRFLGLSQFEWGRKLASQLSPLSERGLWTVRSGLAMYDWIARSSLLPRHSVHRLSDAGTPRVDPQKFRWVCSYWDAQMQYPERFVLALLKDAQAHATEHNVAFEVLPYHQVVLSKRTARIFPVQRDGSRSAEPVREFEPTTIINATGAGGDYTLKQLGIDTERLFGGTKGSHIITSHQKLREAIADDGIYAESGDGRLVFVLPFGPSTTLVGTTDLRFDRPPEEAIASDEEVQYLVKMVNSVISNLDFSTADVNAHYCGVRPLPFVPSGRTGSIPRGHSISTIDHQGIPLHTLIGGKLTTWRAFGEEVVDAILPSLGRERTVDSKDRLIPGAEGYPADIASWLNNLADSEQDRHAAQFLFPLMGTQAADLIIDRSDADSRTRPELPVPASIIHRIIEEEWVQRLEDLVERRLMLVFGDRLTRQTLVGLADCLVAAGKLDADQRDRSVNSCKDLLKARYGITLKQDDSG